MTSRDELIEQMKKVLSVRGQYQVDYHAGKFTVSCPRCYKGNKARFIQWPEFMADLILADRKRICEPLVKVVNMRGTEMKLIIKTFGAVEEALKRAGVEND